jgi:hypothetical protein
MYILYSIPKYGCRYEDKDNNDKKEQKQVKPSCWGKMLKNITEPKINYFCK